MVGLKYVHFFVGLLFYVSEILGAYRPPKGVPITSKGRIYGGILPSFAMMKARPNKCEEYTASCWGGDCRFGKCICYQTILDSEVPDDMQGTWSGQFCDQWIGFAKAIHLPNSNSAVHQDAQDNGTGKPGLIHGDDATTSQTPTQEAVEWPSYAKRIAMDGEERVYQVAPSQAAVVNMKTTSCVERTARCWGGKCISRTRCKCYSIQVGKTWQQGKWTGRSCTNWMYENKHLRKGKCYTDGQKKNCFHGRCVEAKSGKSACRCNDPYVGATCEETCNPPCKNKGRCIRSTLTDPYADLCLCPLGWAGQDCGEVFNCLDKRTCDHGGKCVVGQPSDYRRMKGQGLQHCDCPIFTTGRYCETTLPGTDRTKCGPKHVLCGFGKCINDACDCHAGYTYKVFQPSRSKGYTTDESCSTKCPLYTFGKACTGDCSTSHCTREAECNHVTGKCDHGCKAGWSNDPKQTIPHCTKKISETRSSVRASLPGAYRPEMAEPDSNIFRTISNAIRAVVFSGARRQGVNADITELRTFNGSVILEFDVVFDTNEVADLDVRKLASEIVKQGADEFDIGLGDQYKIDTNSIRARPARQISPDDAASADSEHLIFGLAVGGLVITIGATIIAALVMKQQSSKSLLHKRHQKQVRIGINSRSPKLASFASGFTHKKNAKLEFQRPRQYSTRP